MEEENRPEHTNWSVTATDVVALTLSGVTCLALIILLFVKFVATCRRRRRSETVADNESWATPYRHYDTYRVWEDMNSSLLTCSTVSSIEVAQENDA
ncbi:hypothetical protein LSH36_1289g00065 [Paralvinella palmiformis]|uniref:Uncharacterized protein n=1 Tax=Paralvinella palmiformis TaxID=53620 RepID=A0AAD9ITK8_9ANNE|nr:hypothetical protein LSH36_1289g00065 [Paralvinella palmiformis]